MHRLRASLAWRENLIVNMFGGGTVDSAWGTNALVNEPGIHLTLLPAIPFEIVGQ